MLRHVFNSLSLLLLLLLLLDTAAKKNILCLGDSLTREGSWIRFVANYFSLSSRKEKLIFINGGKNGRKSSELLYPLVHTYSKQHKLDGIIIFIGVNDLNNLVEDLGHYNTTIKHVLDNIQYINGHSSFTQVIFSK